MNNKPQVKLFIDAHIFDGVPQGTLTYIIGIYSELVNDERFLIYVGGNDKTLAEQYLKSSNFIFLEYKTYSKVKRLLWTIPMLLKKYQIDLAHFQYITPIIKRCKYVVTIHDLLFLDFPESFPLLYRLGNGILFYLSAIRSDLVFTVSKYSKQSISNHFKIPSGKIQISPNAVISSNLTGTPIKNLVGKKFMLYVSRIEPRKNQAILIQLWRDSFHQSELNLVLVGAKCIHDKIFDEQLELMTKEEKKNFHWLRNLPQENLIWLYKNCSLFIYPSTSEGFGIPPLEAALYGAKVLCSNTTAMKDFNFFGDFLISPHKENIKEKIKWALDTDFPHKQVIREIEETYNWKNIAKNFAENLLELNGKN